MIQPMDLINKFLYAWNNGWGYIWGAAGLVWTAERQKNATREQTKLYGSKWIGHHVVDCSGLFYWAFKQLGGYMYHGSNTMYDKYCTAKGKLSGGKKNGQEPLLPGTAVFTGGITNKSHVGLYIGNNEVIEAAGTQQGVIKSKLSNSKWTYWGELKGVEYGSQHIADLIGNEGSSGSTTKPTSGTATGSTTKLTKTIRKGDRGEEVAEIQRKLIDLGFSCGSTGADGIFGSYTLTAVKQFQQYRGLTVDGVVGPLTLAALETASKPGKTYTVIIMGCSKEQTTALLRQFPEADVKEERG